MSQDEPRLITRRHSLQLLAGAGGSLFIAGSGSFAGSAVARTVEGDDHASAAGCHALTAEQEEGPYYVPVERVREDIRLGEKGLPFRLEITIINTRTCKPLRHAALDVWHCNASGVYSDESSESTLGHAWLRGVQFTDKHGRATFHTIYPGHYSGRTTHVHVRVHTGSQARHGKLSGGHVAHTGNLFPPDAVNLEVYKFSPYRAETTPILTHSEDRVYATQNGNQALMKVSKAGHRFSKGLVGRITLGVDPRATPALIGVSSQ